MALLTAFWVLDVLLAAIAVFTAIYTSFYLKFQYWKKKNVPMPHEPSFPYGHFAGMTRKRALALMAVDLYNEMPKKAKFYGAYIFSRPILMIRDLELVKTMLVKDFSSFHDRGFLIDTRKEPLAGHLFLMNGQDWRNLRIKLTPTFTTGKIRMMFQTIKDVGKELEKHFEKCAKDPETEIRDVLSRYTTDVISSCAFGIETNSLQNPDAEFRRIGQEIVNPNWKRRFANIILFTFPTLGRYLPLKVFPVHMENFFFGVVRETVEYRTKNNVQRNDFFHLLMQFMNLGYIPDADSHVKEDAEHQMKFTLEQATAQAFLFFFAGFETSSATMQFALYELALNPEHQEKVQEEVDNAMAKHGGELTYDAIQEMDLLDRVVSETLRMYPVAAALIRECTSQYVIPDTNVVVEKGINVWFSVYAIHHDPEHWADPEKFDPDRFLPEEKEKRNHYAYLPFGEGPRNCIGNRFALVQTKTGLATVLSRFTLAPSKRTPIPLEFDPATNTLAPKGPLYLKITQRAKH